MATVTKSMSLDDLLSFEDTDLLRAAKLTTVMARFGRVFANSKGSAKSFALSRPVEKIGCFVSHNWVCRRLGKFLALCLYFNGPLALVTSLITIAVMSTCLATGAIPVDSQVGYWYVTEITMLVCLLALLFGQCLPELLGRGVECFVDKLCIHQTDAELKKQGILKLSAFLAHTSTLVICYSDLYLRKLWTVYEVSAFLALRGAKDIRIVPVAFPAVVLVGLVVPTAALFAVKLLSRTYPALSLEGSAIAITIPMGIFAACLNRSWRCQQYRLRQRISEFDVKETNCFDPSDRPLVEGNIITLWTALAHRSRKRLSDEEALKSFNEYAREQLPLAFQATLGVTGWPYVVVLLLGLAFGAGNAETWAIDVATGSLHGRAAVLHLVGTIDFVFLSFPISFAFSAAVYNRCLGLKSWCAEALYVGLGYLVNLCFWTLVGPDAGVGGWLQARAAASDVWLAVFLARLALLLAAVWAVFGPRLSGAGSALGGGSGGGQKGGADCAGSAIGEDDPGRGAGGAPGGDPPLPPSGGSGCAAAAAVEDDLECGLGGAPGSDPPLPPAPPSGGSDCAAAATAEDGPRCGDDSEVSPPPRRSGVQDKPRIKASLDSEVSPPPRRSGVQDKPRIKVSLDSEVSPPPRRTGVQDAPRIKASL